MGRDPSDTEAPYESRAESPIVNGEPGSLLTPMGQVDSIGSFARGLGAHRTKIALGLAGGVLLLLAVLAALG